MKSYNQINFSYLFKELKIFIYFLKYQCDLKKKTEQIKIFI
jgi:hypothetical protein